MSVVLVAIHSLLPSIALEHMRGYLAITAPECTASLDKNCRPSTQPLFIRSLIGFSKRAYEEVQTCYSAIERVDSITKCLLLFLRVNAQTKHRWQGTFSGIWCWCIFSSPLILVCHMLEKSILAIGLIGFSEFTWEEKAHDVNR